MKISKLQNKLLVLYFLGMGFPFFALQTVNAAEKEFVYDAHEKRDPFWSLVSSSGSILNYNSDMLISEMHLEGVMAGTDGKNIAIINGQVIQSSAKIGEYTVSEIYSNKVVLIKNNERYELLLKKEE